MQRPVTILPYDPSWPRVFADISAHLWPELEPYATRVEHVGSTAVPGCAAKPVIDVDVVLQPGAQRQAAISALERLGYLHKGDGGIPGRESFSPPATLPYHHLYLCDHSSVELRRHILFRDYLRQHPQLVEAYSSLKADLAVRFRHDRLAYTEGKTRFIQHVLTLASRGASETGPPGPQHPA